MHGRTHVRTHTALLCEQVQAIYAHFIDGTITKQIAYTWKQFYTKADELYNTVQLVQFTLIQIEPFFITRTLITICNLYTNHEVHVKKNQLDAQLILSIFSQPLHVSGIPRPIIRR
jgi:hypothetical protein